MYSTLELRRCRVCGFYALPNVPLLITFHSVFFFCFFFFHFRNFTFYLHLPNISYFEILIQCHNFGNKELAFPPTILSFFFLSSLLNWEYCQRLILNFHHLVFHRLVLIYRFIFYFYVVNQDRVASGSSLSGFIPFDVKSYLSEVCFNV